MMSSGRLEQALVELADADRAVQMGRYFKTGPGEYGEGDRFFGIRVPQLRKLAKQYTDLPLDDIIRLLHSTYHEQRMTALLILTYQFPKQSKRGRAEIFRSYLDNTRWINHWDLVDVTAPHILGAYLWERSRKPLYTLAASESLWERRMAVVATLYFIRCGQFKDTLDIVDLLIEDSQDLIHKATGWMLREVGKQNQDVLERYLLARYSRMPRTMLRYAIEKLPESRRQAYLKGTL